MANIEKKENKLKKFVSDHKDEIMTCGIQVMYYAIGVGVGYFLGRPNKRIREFYKKGTRGVYGFDGPADVVTTAGEIFGDNVKYLHEVGVEPDDRIVSYMFSIAKSET